jgi:hypothetical protein
MHRRRLTIARLLASAIEKPMVEVENVLGGIP